MNPVPQIPRPLNATATIRLCWWIQWTVCGPGCLKHRASHGSSFGAVVRRGLQTCLGVGILGEQAMAPIANTFAYMIQKAGYISSQRFDVFSVM